MTLPALAAEDFAEFFETVNGVEPFPWQAALAQRVCRTEIGGDRWWPEALDIPTGAGKTAAIDVAVFHLALTASAKPGARAPLRVMFVVDRRLVVDDAFDRAARLADALARAAGERPRRSVLARVAARLGGLAEKPERPLAVARLRGGVPKENDWVRTPSQPAVLVSTVDQVGSRLLFRGYGVTDTMKSVHAGLLGVDSLLLLDEAHLSQPFVETLRALRSYHGGDKADPGTRPVETVTLSATQAAEDPFRITAKDRKHAVLGPRLRASKPAELVKIKDVEGSTAHNQAFVERALEASRLGGGPACVVAVVVNRVARARAIHVRLAERAAALAMAKQRVAPRVVLLMGRTRSIERERVLADILPWIRSGRASTEDDPELFIVATQCVEAGADLDFDALVTEIAPLDCLRQRFGRLNRMGRPIDAVATVIAAGAQVGSRSEDVLYGRALPPTWASLEQAGVKVGKKGPYKVDLGVAAAEEWLPRGEDLAACLAPRASAPVLLPTYVELWTQTSPVPAVDPDVALFLHGPRSEPPDVQVVWRADLAGPLNETAIKSRLAVCPPSALESVSVPFAAARAWLGRRDVADDSNAEDFGDVEGARTPDAREANEPALAGPRIFRWAGLDSESTGEIRPRELRPGDLVVVPSSRGGCDAWGWSPSSTSHVRDLGREANEQQRGRRVLRFHSHIIRQELIGDDAKGDDQRAALAAAEELARLVSDLREVSNAELRRTVAETAAMPEIYRSAAKAHQCRVMRDDDGIALALQIPFAASNRDTGESSTEDDDGARGQLGRQVLLVDHSRGVGAKARELATALALPKLLVEDVELAGFLHDAGKAHPAFKKWLYGGDELAAWGPALAKSGRASIPTTARERSGLPKGARHEVASLRFAVAHPRFADAHDPDLVLWLIGTHHGYGRPLFPAVAWPPRDETFVADLGDGVIESHARPQAEDPSSGWVELAVRVRSRYGPWAVARLEAVLRLADHRRSEAEQQEPEA